MYIYYIHIHTYACTYICIRIYKYMYIFMSLYILHQIWGHKQVNLSNKRLFFPFSQSNFSWSCPALTPD